MATFASIFIIWYSLVRPESSDWLVAQVVHQVSPYAVSQTPDGLIIGNVVAGYEFKTPPGFKTLGARNLSFYLEEEGVKKCEIRHYVKRAGVVAKAENLVFELTDKREKDVCGKYLLSIRNSLAVD